MSTQNYSEKELAKIIFHDYMKTRRPRKDALEIVDITLGLNIFAVNDVLEKTGQIQITACLAAVSFIFFKLLC